jgi:hypothetical protein
MSEMPVLARQFSTADSLKQLAQQVTLVNDWPD